MTSARACHLPLWHSVAAALVLIACAPGALANSASPRMALFSRSWETKHYYSTWSGSAWGAATQYNTGPDESIWMMAANCPTRDEIAVATQDYSFDVRLYFRTSGGFSSATLCTGDSGSLYPHRRFDVAYEQSSGDMLIAYYDKVNTKIGFRTYSGTSVSAQSLLTLPSSAHLRFLALVPKPNSNEITLLVVNASGVLYACTWDGSAWGSVSTLCSSVSNLEKECFAGVYERSSGDLLVVYGKGISSQARYRVYSGGSWGAELTMPAAGGAMQWMRLAAKPNADEIACGILDWSDAVFALVWNGSSWGTVQSLGSTGGVCEHRRIDVAYQPDGAKGLVAYSTGASTLRYRTWDGSSWSAQQNGPNFGAIVDIVRLSPGNSGSEILGLCTDQNWRLNAFAWNGTSISGSLINDPLGGESNCEAFALVPPHGSKKRVVSWRQSAP